MGFGFWETSAVLGLVAGGHRFEKVLTLGRQANRLNSAMVGVLEQRYDRKLPGGWQGATWIDPFLKGLLETQVEAMDFSPYEEAAVIHDLNQPWPPEKARPAYDLVIDGGTLEHIYNVPTAVDTVASLVAPNGVFVSVTPADGWLSHGFYQLQPEFFFRRFGVDSGFAVLGIWLAEYGPDFGSLAAYRLRDPAETGLRVAVPGRRPLVMIACLQRVGPATTSACPQQSNYTAQWKSEERTQTPAVPKATLKSRVLPFIPKSLKALYDKRRVAARRAREAAATYERVDKLTMESRAQ
jgi:hypothetical protein